MKLINKTFRISVIAAIGFFLFVAAVAATDTTTTLLTPQQVGNATNAINAGENILSKVLPLKYQALAGALGILATFLITLIGHITIHKKVDAIAKKTAPVILVLIMLSMSSCSVGSYITKHCSINPSVTASTGGSGSVCFSCDSVALLLNKVPANLMLAKPR